MLTEMDALESATGLGSKLLGQIGVASTLNPLLWLSVAVSVIFLPAAYVFRDLPFLLYPLAFIPILAFCGTLAVGFVYAFRFPNRLDSEQHRENMAKMRTKSGAMILSPELENPVKAPGEDSAAGAATS
jgi:hypothetical protein